MRLVFLRKEFIEFFKTYRFYVLFGVFAFFGLLNAPTAKYLPEIISGIPDVGFEINMPDPVFRDSYIQFASNVTNAFFALIIVFMGCFSTEFKKGTAYLVLSKGVKRSDFYISKFINAFLMYTVSYAAYSVITILTTMLLFPQWNFDGIGLFLLSPYIFGFMTLSIVLGASSLANSAGPGVFAGFAVLIFMPMTDLIGKAGRHLPGKLLSLPLELLAGKAAAGDVILPVVTALVLAFIVFGITLTLFLQREI